MNREESPRASTVCQSKNFHHVYWPSSTSRVRCASVAMPVDLVVLDSGSCRQRGSTGVFVAGHVNILQNLG